MPDIRTLIALHEAAQATRDPERPINVIRVAMLRTAAWRQDAAYFEKMGLNVRPGSQGFTCLEMAETGERLGLERVGVVVETETVPVREPCPYCGPDQSREVAP